MYSPSAADRRFNFADLTILIVDGNDFARSFSRNLCRGFRFGQVLTTGNPEEAIELLQTKQIDVVLTEWQMKPFGGDALVRRIRTMRGILNSCVPVVVLTACIDLETVAQARDAGATEFLTRPLVVGSLLQRLTHVFTAPRPFVRAPNYYGPDRRRQQRPFNGRERRGRGGTAPAALPASFAIAVEKLQRAGGMTMRELVKVGNEVIAREEERYTEVRARDLEELAGLVARFKAANPPDPDLIETVYLKSHDLKGMGKTFGFPLLTAAGESLCKLLWQLPPERAMQAILKQGVETHAMVMNLIVEKNIRDDGGEIGTELVRGLHTLVGMAGAPEKKVAGAR